jgi:hypothetical protein
MAGDYIEADGPEGPRDLTVALVVPFHQKERQANARLIAAAPELLAALKMTVSLLKYAATDGGIRGDNADEWWGMEAQCDAAIAKAEGSA